MFQKLQTHISREAVIERTVGGPSLLPSRTSLTTFTRFPSADFVNTGAKYQPTAKVFVGQPTIRAGAPFLRSIAMLRAVRCR